MRVIDVDELKRHMGIEDAVKYGNETEEQQHNSYATLMNYEISDFIDDMPTLDYAPVVHGYWKHEEPVKDDGQKPFVCSTCGLRHPRYGDVDKAYFSYCPWCGTPMDAEMDGGKDDG